MKQKKNVAEVFVEFKETFVRIDDYPAYMISDHGTVLRVENGCGNKVKPRELKPNLNEAGYERVRLFNTDGAKQRFVHHLVLENFVGTRPSPTHNCDHVEGNKRDNRASKLEWVTPSVNVTRATSRPRKTPVKFGEKDIVAIHMLRRFTGIKMDNLSEMYNTSKRYIRKIIAGDVWKDVFNSVSYIYDPEFLTRDKVRNSYYKHTYWYRKEM